MAGFSDLRGRAPVIHRRAAIRSGLTAPANLARTLQERAYTSPIWYTPAH